MRRIEGAIEFILISSRWVLAPFYVGLAVSLLVLLSKFCISLFDLIRHVPTSSESDIIAGVLGLINVALVGCLVVIVIFSGYRSFVSTLTGRAESVGPQAWMTALGVSRANGKLLALIVLITSTEVLEALMTLEQQPNTVRLAWLVGIFALFIIATLVVALADRLAHRPE